MWALVCILLLWDLGTSANAQQLKIRAQMQGDTLIFWASNKIPCDITLSATAEFQDTTFTAFIPKNQELKLLYWPNASNTLFAQLEQTLKFTFLLGNPNAFHDDNYRYNLPFPPGESHILSQGNNTPFTHNDSASRYAFDFAMPEGSYIAAARGGMVGYVEEKNTIGGEDKGLLSKSNRIMICHNDGTVAAYAHLQYKGALVKVGDPVFAGQVIGLSGNTGFTTSPHLHFAVLIANRSIPIQFRNEYTTLYEGEIYHHK